MIWIKYLVNIILLFLVSLKKILLVSQQLAQRVLYPFNPINNPFNQINKPFNPINNPFNPINNPFNSINNPFNQINNPFNPINNPFNPIYNHSVSLQFEYKLNVVKILVKMLLMYEFILNKNQFNIWKVFMLSLFDNLFHLPMLVVLTISRQ